MLFKGTTPLFFSFLFQMSKSQDLVFLEDRMLHFQHATVEQFCCLETPFFRNFTICWKKFCSALLWRAFVSVHYDVGGGKWRGEAEWIGDTICYKIYPMIHGLFYKRWIKTDLDYYKWHWSKILECSGPTDEEDKQHAFQKHRNLHRLVQEGTPWNSIYCFLICSLNSLSLMTIISNPTNYINQYSLPRAAQREVGQHCWRCALCDHSLQSRDTKLTLLMWVWRRNVSCRPDPSS